MELGLIIKNTHITVFKLVSLINSSNWQWFRIKVLSHIYSWLETRSSGTGGSHPGQES